MENIHAYSKIIIWGLYFWALFLWYFSIIMMIEGDQYQAMGKTSLNKTQADTDEVKAGLGAWATKEVNKEKRDEK